MVSPSLSFATPFLNLIRFRLRVATFLPAAACAHSFLFCCCGGVWSSKFGANKSITVVLTLELKLPWAGLSSSSEDSSEDRQIGCCLLMMSLNLVYVGVGAFRLVRSSSGRRICIKKALNDDLAEL